MILVLITIIVLDNVNKTNKIRVACMGDSITEEYNYPSQLQTMLGENYTVDNFGSSGATVLFDTHNAYWNTDDFFEAREVLPNIVVIMLGTNDARTDNFQSIDNFVADYTKILNQIQLLGTKPKIFVVKPPPIFDNKYDLQPESFSEKIIPLIEQVANEQKITIIDVYSEMKNHPEYLIDGVHPTTEGAKVIATQVYDAIISSN
ncbi:MAG: GDSL-type esterase/lipase family protein [Candidatus Bathyarchaeota archaeon]